MAESFIKIPKDDLNAGPKIRTNKRNVAGNDVHEHYAILLDIVSGNAAGVTVDSELKVLDSVVAAAVADVAGIDFAKESGGNLAAIKTNSDDLVESFAPEITNMGVSGFDVTGGDTDFTAIEITQPRKGSIEISWAGVTSSDSFASPGQVAVEISNSGANWATLFTTPINSASGSVINRQIECDFRYIRLVFTQNNLTAGTLNASAIFKGV